MHSGKRDHLTFICVCFPLPCINLVLLTLLRVEVVAVEVDVDVEVALVVGLRMTGTGLGSMVTLVLSDPADTDGQTRSRLLARSSSSNSPFRLTRRLNRPVRVPVAGFESAMRPVVSCL